MSELYLIAHKVRGEPAFDIATQIECPLCAGHSHGLDGVCHECDSTGFWWIIPTSGHRAFPWQSWDLDNLGANSDIGFDPDLADPMPDNCPDHYHTSASLDKPKIDLTALLPKAPPIRRRV